MSQLDQQPTQFAGPTVLSAMRRHRWLVVVIVLACTALAAAWGLVGPHSYRATATVSAPRPAGSAMQTDQQYLDSQVLLLNSSAVRAHALRIASGSPHGGNISRADFAASDGAVEVIPPVTDSSGSYGTTIITITFTAAGPDAAQVGANALAEAYDDARAQQIRYQAESRLAGLDEAIAQAATGGAAEDLRAERAQTLIDRGTDLAQGATINVADRPTSPANQGLASLVGVGLCFGLLAGGAGAFLRASRLGHVGEPHVAGQVYGAPMLWQGGRPRSPRRSRRDSPLLTEPDRLLARAVMHRVAALGHGGAAVFAVVAAPGHRDRSASAAGVALALAEAGHSVLAVDGADGTLTRRLGPDTASILRRDGTDPVVASPQHGGLSVLDLSDGVRPAQYERLLLEWEDVVVLDSPAPQSTARAVDLLSSCDAAVILVRPDEPVREHVEIARWLELTGTVAIGYAFAPLERRTASRPARTEARRSVRATHVRGGQVLSVRAHQAARDADPPGPPLASTDDGRWQHSGGG